MALPAERLPQGELLDRYLAARARYEPPPKPQPRPADVVLARYLRALEHEGEPESEFRTCPSCGERVRLRADGSGGWAACPACGHLA